MIYSLQQRLVDMEIRSEKVVAARKELNDKMITLVIPTINAISLL